MLTNFKPTWMIPDVYRISPEFLFNENIKIVLTDLDNTIIPWNSAKGSKALESWLNELKKFGIRVIVVSNNSHTRILEAIADYHLPFVSRAMKPLRFGIERAIKKFNLDKTKVVMIGDQLMTDIYSANRAHVKSILVKPLVNNDALSTTINRQAEKVVWSLLSRRYTDFHWQ